MSASDPQGGQQFWFNGVPFPGLKTGNDTGTVKFWFNGVPAGYVFPATGNVSISPAAATLQLTTTTPVLNAPISLTPTVASLTLTGLAPVIALRTVIQPAAGLLSLATNAPVLSTYTVLTPAVATLALTTTTPTLSINTGLTPTVATLTLTTTTPVLRTTIQPAAGLLSLTTNTPVLSTYTVLTPTVATLTLTTTTPIISSPPASASLTLTRNSPIIAIEETLFPASDVATGTWTNESGGLPLWPSIDENSPNDADYIQSASAPVNDLCKIGLSTTPDTLVAPFNVFYRFKKDIAGTQIKLTVALLQGATQIASWSHTDISTTLTTVQQTLTAPQLASISDFTNLFVTFNASIYIGPGDIVPGAIGWWGLRAYSVSTIGTRAIRLRRDSDQAESDFNTLTDGSLDVASISTFKGAANLFVTTLYDQSGNALDLIQTTTANQIPFSLSVLGAFPSLAPVGSATQTMKGVYGGTSLSEWSMSAVAQRTTFTASKAPEILTRDSATGMWFDTTSGQSFAWGVAGKITLTGTPDNTWLAFTQTNSASTETLNANGGTVSSGFTGASPINTGANLGFGNNDPLNGNWMEGGVWPVAFSSVQIANTTANQRSYWGF